MYCTLRQEDHEENIFKKKKFNEDHALIKVMPFNIFPPFTAQCAHLIFQLSKVHEKSVW